MAIFLTCFWAVGTPFLTWKTIQLWRDPEQVAFFERGFTFLPFGPEVRRGEVRSLAVTAVGVWAITVLVLVGVWDAEGEMRMASLIAFVCAFLLLMTCVVVEVAVILFNRPKFVVPPHMRSDPGVIAERRSRRRATRKKPESRLLDRPHPPPRPRP
ncbi:hypothetical protein [Streptomyces blattellae]|uniref:hypothetical protein n=1 Tax=Streptomyces blattellae TaxID=2569855 RepID=UPI0012B91136|nr:hypothetical protein [Streptomyces blattellae]